MMTVKLNWLVIHNSRGFGWKSQQGLQVGARLGREGVYSEITSPIVAYYTQF